MKPVEFGRGGCTRTLQYLDSYLADELLVETNHEVLRHVEYCPSCAAELDARTRVRARLREAVRAEITPPDVQARVRQQIQARGSRIFFAAEWTRWAAAAAACFVVAAGVVVMTNRPEPVPELADRAGQNAYIERVSQTVASVLRLGLGDHIHCSVFRRYPANPPTFAEMQEKLGQSFQGFLPIVQQHVPAEYQVILAHQCSFNGRRYVHLTLQNRQHLLSLVIARKNPGESLSSLTAAQRPGGIPVYQSAAHHYEVAGFETPEYMAFVVSDLGAGRNLQIAAGLARWSTSTCARQHSAAGITCLCPPPGCS